VPPLPRRHRAGHRRCAGARAPARLSGVPSLRGAFALSALRKQKRIRRGERACPRPSTDSAHQGDELG
jgi:hypothetical protein